MAEPKKKVATLAIVVEYDDLPDVEEIKSNIEALRGYGRIAKADLVILKDTTIDMR